ncbi:MAG: peptidase and D,D-carboxypeptidase VanY/endolysin [Bryobacterales bacterium]|nr:peptidase and D,D-carboxypeptidase VanY/endolysin [Bryobacterales bacterium]
MTLNTGHAFASASGLADSDETMEVSPLPAAPSASLEAQFRSIRRNLMFAGCRVAPLRDVWAPEALAFETSPETASADVDRLVPDAALALDTLKEMVTSLGGRFELKSAYRPAAYQDHLHEVWVKWVKELRNNRSSGCRALREDVGAEFARHQLLIRQQPAPASDHALGLAFDAAVAMPRIVRMNGKRVTVDKLAAMAGIKRPNSRRDPVHFTLLPERLHAIRYAQQFPSL